MGLVASAAPLVGLAALVAVTGTAVVLQRPRYVVYLLVGVVPVVAGLARGVPVPGLRLGEVLIVVLAACAVAVLPARALTQWNRFDSVALAYVAATLVLGAASTWSRGDVLSGEDLGQLFGPLQFFLLYRVARAAASEYRTRQVALSVVLATAVPVALLTLLQVQDVGPVRSLIVDLTGEDLITGRESWTVIRATGPFSHWTMLSGYGMAIAALAVALLLRGDPRRSRLLLGSALASAAIILALSVTFASIVGAILAVAALYLWNGRWTRLVPALAVAAAIGTLFFAPLFATRLEEQFTPGSGVLPRNLANRVELWNDQYLPVVGDNLIIGYGPQIPPTVTFEYTESIYFEMLLRGGLPLLCIYLLLTWRLFQVAQRLGASRRDPDDIAAGQALAVLTASLALIQLIVPHFVTTGLPHLWWGLAGIVMAASDRGVPESNRAKSRTSSP